MKEKVVLAYSGGLDTTAIIPWLKETPANPKSSTARPMASTCPSPRTPPTAATAISGTSATRGWSWRIPPMSRTSSISWYWA